MNLNHTQALSLKKLHHLIMLVEEGSYSRACEKLFITQSALTRSIQSLEDEFELQLIDRLSKGVRPTPEGQHVVTRARELIRSANGFRQDIALLHQGQLGSVKFGVGPMLAELSSQVLADFSSRESRLNISCEYKSPLDLLQRLLEEKIDFFIADVSQFTQRNDIRVTALRPMTVNYFVRKDHPLTKLKSVSLDKAFSYPLAGPSFDENVLPADAEQIIPRSNWSSTILCDNANVIIAIALRSNAIALVSAEATDQNTNKNALVRLKFDDWETDLKANLHVVSLADRQLSKSALDLITSFKEKLLG